MGKQAKTVKDRTCSVCEQSFFMNAKEIKAHAELCFRMNKLGLVVPGIKRPEIQIVRE